MGYICAMSNQEDDDAQVETEEQAEREPVDETTAREALETELMDEDDSEAGKEIGEHIE
jgi:hypothetical protein